MTVEGITCPKCGSVDVSEPDEGWCVCAECQIEFEAPVKKEPE